MDSVAASPVTPTSPSAANANSNTKKLNYPTMDSRTMNLEILREQLRSAKIPLTKRASITEVPLPAEDCSLVPGTTRCQLPLCADDCTQSHRHHHSHARPTKQDATLVYSRPSISMLPGSGVVSNFASPAGSPSVSMPGSQTNSPQHQYRRASAYGFNIGTRGSVTSTNSYFGGVGSGGVTPAELMSGPPSPISEANFTGLHSNPSSQPVSPRQVATTFQPDFTEPILEEKEQLVIATSNEPNLASSAPSAAAASSSSSSHPQHNASLGSDFWKLRDRIVNLCDYRLGNVGKSTQESLTRKDLAPAPREDCPVQGEDSCAWDPRSPQPPSPVEMLQAEVVRVNMNEEDPTHAEIQYELKPNSK